MTRKHLLAAATLLVAGCSGRDEPADSGANADAGTPGWTTLFDGSSYDGWGALGDANWWLMDEAVSADEGMGGFLTTNDSYRDFELDLEFWVSEDANSGVFIRCADRARIDATTCYEINIYDQRPDPTYRTGAVVDVAPAMEQINAGGQWNRYHITAEGSHLTVVLNGITTAEADDERLPDGPIALQYGAGTVRFRNIRLRPL